MSLHIRVKEESIDDVCDGDLSPCEALKMKVRNGEALEVERTETVTVGAHKGSKRHWIAGFNGPTDYIWEDECRAI